MKRFGFHCFIGASLVSTLIVADVEARYGGNEVPNRKERHLRADISFPRMYTAITPCPGKNEAGVDAIHFAAEVDLMGIVEYGVNLTTLPNKTGSDFCRISFLVHNALELGNIEALMANQTRTRTRSTNREYFITSNLEQDCVETKRMVQTTFVNSSVAHHTGDRRLLSYATIPGFTCYRSLAGMGLWMLDTVTKSKQIPNLSIVMKDIGNSYEGRNISALIITGNGVAAAGRSTVKAPMFVMSGLHAREYAPPELVARWVDFLVNAYGKDAEVTSTLDHTEIHLVLQANPDGRRIAESNRPIFQRKSSHDYGNCGDSGGVDLNRNFPFQWGRNDGSSSDPCAETYRGPSAASEPEVKALIKYISSVMPTDQRNVNVTNNEAYPDTAKGVFIDIHSYGESIIWPWGYTEAETPNDVGLETLVNKYRHFNTYASSGPYNSYLYAASGISIDWTYSTTGAAGMTFEIGTDFYQDCTYFESSIVQKNIRVLTYAAKIAGAPYSLPKGPDVTSIQFGATSVTYNGVLTVRPTVSDAAWSASSYETSKQLIASIRAWVDIHPTDVGAGSGEAVGGFIQNTSGTSTGSYSIQASQYSIGQHTIYFQATDTDGIKGPVSAAFFTIVTEIVTPTKPPTKQPTRLLTKQPTRLPTKFPAKIPTKRPS